MKNISRNWSEIHSFKLELLEGETLEINNEIILEFNMKAPTAEAVNQDITNPEIDKFSRAAWNSFAVSINDLQPVEPSRVGVVMNVEDPQINKDVENQTHLDLVNRHDEFDWNIRVSFWKLITIWEQAIIQDEINELLDIVSVKVINGNGQDVTTNGILTVDKNVVKFELNQKDGSFSHLAGRTLPSGSSNKN